MVDVVAVVVVADVALLLLLLLPLEKAFCIVVAICGNS